MITRSFLFLLAMLTGLSAAQAAEAAHRAPTSIGASIAAPTEQSAHVLASRRMRAMVHIMAIQPRAFIIGTKRFLVSQGHQAVAAKRTFRGERTRE